MSQGTIAAVLSSISALCVIATVYPYVLYPAILRLLPQRQAILEETPSYGGREFALLFCAYNEANSIPTKLDNLRNLRKTYPHLEILAYDDCSSDGTAEMIEKSGLDIRLVRGSRTGKAHGMKVLVSMTQREFLVFTDANVEVDHNALHRLRTAYANRNVGGVCGLLQYVDAKASPVAEAGGLYWRLEELIKSLESRSGNVMGADGSIFSVRRELYPNFPDTVLDDLTVSLAVIFQGRRLIKDPLVIGRERLVTLRPDDFNRRVRIATRAFHTHLWLRPQIRRMTLGERWRYWSHRYVRWHGAFFLVGGYLALSVALGLLGGWQLAAFATITTLIVYWAATYLQLGPLAAAAHMLTSILITGIGVTRARRGGTMTTWKPPESRTIAKRGEG